MAGEDQIRGLDWYSRRKETLARQDEAERLGRARWEASIGDGSDVNGQTLDDLRQLGASPQLPTTEPKPITVRPGDGFDRIARRMTGPDADPAQVRHKSEQLADYNGIHDLRSLKPGQSLFAPPEEWEPSGQTAGAFRTEDRRYQADREQEELDKLLKGTRYSGLRGAELQAALDDSWRESQEIAAAAEARASANARAATNIIPRDEWANQRPDRAHLQTDKLPKTVITLHDTGHENSPEAVEFLHRGGENWWRTKAKERGLPVQDYVNWGDVGYDFMVGQDGKIYEGRNLRYEAAHVDGHNPGNIGIAAIGDYRQRPMPSAQAQSVADLVNLIEARNSIQSVKTHGQFNPNKKAEMLGAVKQIGPLLK